MGGSASKNNEGSTIAQNSLTDDERRDIADKRLRYLNKKSMVQTKSVPFTCKDSKDSRLDKKYEGLVSDWRS